MSAIHCSFCGKGNSDVSMMIAGPSDVAICAECVFLCCDITLKHAKNSYATKQFASTSAPKASQAADEKAVPPFDKRGTASLSSKDGGDEE